MDVQNMNMEDEQNVSEDIGSGYCIKVYVYPNGYSVGDPEPLEEDKSAAGELIESQTDVLKHILAILKSNPVEPSESEGFDQSIAEPQGKSQDY